MIEDANMKNYLLSGVGQKGVPYQNSISGTMPASSLRWPSGWEGIKGVIGQRQIK